MTRPIVVIGARPVGLAAAVDLLIREAGPAVGNTIRQRGNVGMFMPSLAQNLPSPIHDATADGV